MQTAASFAHLAGGVFEVGPQGDDDAFATRPWSGRA
jgi:hypothetical protein